MPPRTFTEVKLVAEHVPETHRTLENDLTVTEQELPGTVDLFFVIDGGRLPFTQLSGSKVFEAIDRAGEEQKAQQAQQQQAAQPEGETQPAQVTTPAEQRQPTQPAPEQPTQ